MLEHSARRDRKISVIGALSISPVAKRIRPYFAIHPGKSIRWPEVLQFVKDLTRHIRGNIILIWDRLQAHRSKVVQAYIRDHKRLDAEFLPAYAPELNPQEYVWGHSKGVSLANYCPLEIGELETTVNATLMDLKGQQQLLRSFMKHTHLPFRFP